MKTLKWQYRPEWCAWWLVFDDGLTATTGYGPFVNEFEIQMAAEVHGVLFTGQTEDMA